MLHRNFRAGLTRVPFTAGKLARGCRAAPATCLPAAALSAHMTVDKAAPCTRPRVGVSRRGLTQVCAHPYLFLERLQPPYQPADAEELVRASGKLALLDGVLPKLRATGHRVLLFSQMTRALDVVEDFLDLRGLPCLRLDGTTKARELSGDGVAPPQTL